MDHNVWHVYDCIESMPFRLLPGFEVKLFELEFPGYIFPVFGELEYFTYI